jgi:hypothetical protein
MPLQQRRWHEFSSRGTLETAAATAILASAQRAIGERGLFRIVLAGGTTPRRVYQALRTGRDELVGMAHLFRRRALPAACRPAAQQCAGEQRMARSGGHSAPAGAPHPG